MLRLPTTPRPPSGCSRKPGESAPTWMTGGGPPCCTPSPSLIEWPATSRGRAGNARARLWAVLTAARAARGGGRPTEAAALLETAASLAESAPPDRLREVLTEWSELAAESGDHARAYELTRRALAIR